MKENKINLLKLMFWDYNNQIIKDEYKYFIVERIPGVFGKVLRYRFLKKRLRKCGYNLLVKEAVKFYHLGKIELGDNVSIGVNCIIEGTGEICIGNDVLIGPGTTIWTSNHIYKNPNLLVNSQGLDLKKVIIGNDVWIGASAFIMPGAIIEDQCIISAGSIVGGKRYKAGSILAGNPARMIGHRN